MAKTPTTLYWQDFQPGDQISLGDYYLSQEELISFASQYDPQVFHTDPVRAASSPIGCLCASGVHTVAIVQKLTVDKLYSRTAVVAGMGVDKLRFFTPVLADETLSVVLQIGKRLRDIKDSSRGIVQYLALVTNPRGEKAASLEATVMIELDPSRSNVSPVSEKLPD